MRMLLPACVLLLALALIACTDSTRLGPPPFTDGDRSDGDASDGDLDRDLAEREYDSDEEQAELFCPDPCFPPDADTRSCAPLCSEANRSVCAIGLGGQPCLCDNGFSLRENRDGCTLGWPITFDCEHVPLLPEQTTFSVDVWGRGNHAEPSCAPTLGEDVMYAFRLAERRTISIKADGFDTALYLRSDCARADSEIVCDDDAGQSGGSLITATLAPGWYVLFIDTARRASGVATITTNFGCGAEERFDPALGICAPSVCMDDPCTAAHRSRCIDLAGDAFRCDCNPGYYLDTDACAAMPENAGLSCLDPLPIPIENATYTGTALEASGVYRPNCVGMQSTGPEIVYTFTLEETTHAAFALGGEQGLIYLRETCTDDDSELACEDTRFGYQESRVRISRVLEAGDYYLFVDSLLFGGDYTLDVTFRPDLCKNDPCPGEPQCRMNDDWTGALCVCGEGKLAFEGACVDDPCADAPCSEPHRSRCAVTEPPNHSCECDAGYIESGDACVLDPAAHDWTVMVYMNADNDLERYGYDDLEEMVAAQPNDRVHVVALFDSHHTEDGLARYLSIEPDGWHAHEWLGEVDMADWRTLAAFGEWTARNFPARHYALVLWNHGSGWTKSSSQPGVKGFSQDDHGGNQMSLSNGEYGRALQAIVSAVGQPLDLIGFDACWMGMWEVAQAGSGFGRYFVASQDSIPDHGWPYESILDALVMNPDMSAENFARTIVNEYYIASFENRTLAAIDTATLPEFNMALSGFAEALMQRPDLYPDLDLLRGQTQTVNGFTVYRDLLDFAERVAAWQGAPEAHRNAALALSQAAQATIVLNRAQNSHPGANGLNIYLPSSEAWMHSAYIGDGSPWKDESVWDEFLLDFAGLPQSP